ncbi:hypothetical protein I548_5249 [Mycobacterium intracellulare]|nr:hypothetical protein I548_5249 [Mycobacterium intracellulare]
MRKPADADLPSSCGSGGFGEPEQTAVTDVYPLVVLSTASGSYDLAAAPVQP